MFSRHKHQNFRISVSRRDSWFSSRTLNHSTVDTSASTVQIFLQELFRLWALTLTCLTMLCSRSCRTRSVDPPRNLQLLQENVCISTCALTSQDSLFICNVYLYFTETPPTEVLSGAEPRRRFCQNRSQKSDVLLVLSLQMKS